MESEEIWKPIPEFDGYYEISNYGRVRSVNRRIFVEVEGKKSYWRVKRSFILKQDTYNSVATAWLVVDNKRTSITISTTVRRVFGDGSKYAFHKDGDFKNNNINNFTPCK